MTQSTLLEPASMAARMSVLVLAMGTFENRVGKKELLYRQVPGAIGAGICV